MWLKVREEGIDVGDQVETIGLGLERERFVARCGHLPTTQDVSFID